MRRNVTVYTNKTPLATLSNKCLTLARGRGLSGDINVSVPVIVKGSSGGDENVTVWCAYSEGSLNVDVNLWLDADPGSINYRDIFYKSGGPWIKCVVLADILNGSLTSNETITEHFTTQQDITAQYDGEWHIYISGGTLSISRNQNGNWVITDNLEEGGYTHIVKNGEVVRLSPISATGYSVIR